MSFDSLEPDDVAKQQGLEIVGEVAQEGRARRVAVRREGGEAGLLYVWQDERLAERAAWVHTPDNGAQLFVVPELVASGPCWCLVEGIDGTPLSDVIFEDPDWFGTPQSAAIIDQVGKTLRKLHTSIAVQFYGDVVETGERWMTFNGYVAAHLETFSEKARMIGLDDQTAQNLLSAIGQARHQLASFHPRGPSGLVHGMPTLEHVWVNRERTSIVGVTGFESAAALPAELDMAWAMWVGGIANHETLIRSLYRGYGAARTMDVQRRERFYRRFVGLLSLFGSVGREPQDVAPLLELIGAA